VCYWTSANSISRVSIKSPRFIRRTKEKTTRRETQSRFLRCKLNSLSNFLAKHRLLWGSRAGRWVIRRSRILRSVYKRIRRLLLRGATFREGTKVPIYQVQFFRSREKERGGPWGYAGWACLEGVACNNDNPSWCTSISSRRMPHIFARYKWHLLENQYLHRTSATILRSIRDLMEPRGLFLLKVDPKLYPFLNRITIFLIPTVRETLTRKLFFINVSDILV